MSDLASIVELDDFSNERTGGLEIEVFASSVKRVEQITIVNLRSINTRE
jgi:hypothetical protein